MKTGQTDPSGHIVTPDAARTLQGLFRCRAERTPSSSAYSFFDPSVGVWKTLAWSEILIQTTGWQRSLAQERLETGARVAIQLNNRPEWVCMDMAALSLGLVVVPLYYFDSPENCAYILRDSGAALLVVSQRQQVEALMPFMDRLPDLKTVVCLDDQAASLTGFDAEVKTCSRWLKRGNGDFRTSETDPGRLASLVYTSGTTGPPKGVMLTHANFLQDAFAVLKTVMAFPEDIFLSFLPLSHSFERTVGYYLPMMAGSQVAYARSPKELVDDLRAVRPTVLISVPRVYEKFYARVMEEVQVKGTLVERFFRLAAETGWRHFQASQGRRPGPGMLYRMLWPLLRRFAAGKVLAAMGGRLRVAVSGAASLQPEIWRFFVSMGLPLLQGYGLTEASPVVSANSLEENVPGSAGRPIPGVEVRIGKHAEILVRGPNVMKGYWKRPEDTRKAVDPEGWLHTGDKGELREGHLFISGRIKEIMVTSTGENVVPSAVESAIVQDTLFRQAMVIGEGMPFLAVLLVLDPQRWEDLAGSLGVEPGVGSSLKDPRVLDAVLKRVAERLRDFPGHVRIYRAILRLEPWTIESGLITPTLKLKRDALRKRFSSEIRELYADRFVPGIHG